MVFLSFRFFASLIAWSVYNSFVPQILAGFITSATLIGFIMTFDNIFGVIFQPLFGKLSDNPHSFWPPYALYLYRLPVSTA
jgi:MFS family permease